MSRSLIQISLEDMLDQSLVAEGFGQIAGALPTYEFSHPLRRVVETSPHYSEDVDVWADTDLVLSRLPVPLLFKVLNRGLGDDWFELDRIVLLDFLRDQDVNVDEAGIGKILAMLSFFRAPDRGHVFYKDFETYGVMCRSFQGKLASLDDGLLPTPLDLGVSNNEAFSLRAGKFSREVLCFMAAICLTHGVWALPSSLRVAQEAVLIIAESEGMDLTRDMVDEVEDLVAFERDHDDFIPEEPSSYTAIQALISLDLEKRIQNVLTSHELQADVFSL